MLPWTVTEKVLRDVEEMRAFYASMGVTFETTERALALRFPNLPIARAASRKTSRRAPLRGRRRQVRR